MITRFLGKVFSGGFFGSRPKIIPASAHGIDRNAISSCALRTTQTLQKGEFAAFVVGGAVRDLILGGKPKDFDIATNATPEEVRGIFRRSRIIGRRFRLVHVLCGPEVVRSEEHTSELQSQSNLVCRLLLEKKKTLKQLKNRDLTTSWNNLYQRSALA